MAVFLGEVGKVELQRKSEDYVITGTVRPADVNADRNRFSFIFPPGVLITGDRVEIRNTADTDLAFVAASAWPDNTQHPDGTFYLYVDEAGGIRLYTTFTEAIAGETQGRLSLQAITENIEIRVTLQDSSYRVLGQVTGFELNNERESVDITALSDDFRHNVSGLVSGSGRITALFDYEYREGDESFNNEAPDNVEIPMYINQLAIRTTTGSAFNAHLILVNTGPKPSGDRSDNDDVVYYEITGRVTNAGVEFSPQEPIRVTMDFVTTGPIHLRTQYSTDYLLLSGFGRLRVGSQQGTGDGYVEVEQEE